MPPLADITAFYHRLGDRAVILDEMGCVGHIGEGRHVRHADDKSPNLTGLAHNAPCPCGSGEIK